MGYIAYIDYKNLDNSLFLKSLAEATSRQSIGITPRIFVHGDSEHTERLIQTGMMRSDAQYRAIRELNRRLVILFADYGVPAIGLNGYQRKLITFDPESSKLTIDEKYLNSLPRQPLLIISNLIHVVGEQRPQVFPIQRYLEELVRLPGISNLYVFSSPNDNIIIDNKEATGEKSPKTEKKDKKKLPPEELVGTSLKAEVMTITKFPQITDN